MWPTPHPLALSRVASGHEAQDTSPCIEQARVIFFRTTRRTDRAPARERDVEVREIKPAAEGQGIKEIGLPPACPPLGFKGGGFGEANPEFGEVVRNGGWSARPAGGPTPAGSPESAAGWPR